ncbi:MAG: PucC family protein [Gammaproteobacteria bacterium]|nr:PucC family protein [Gammaproteobacteria bacterium]
MNRSPANRFRLWLANSPRFLPFADVATPDLPLPRLLRLSLFQVSVGMALVLLVGTLNRVMIVELGVPASLVGVMIAMPVLFAPLRALIGFRSDHHRCALGWRRVPFLWQGSLLQFGGFAIMPFALLVLAGAGHAADAPPWIGRLSAALAFLLVGAGIHVVQTVGLALATDLTEQSSHPRVVGLMYVMLLSGMLGSALLFGHALDDFTPGRLVQVIQTAAVTGLALNAIALWKQEPRRALRTPSLPDVRPSFKITWQHFLATGSALRSLFVVGLGTLAFSMADILLEPFGGQVLGMEVSATTRLTALLAAGGLAGFAFASRVLGRGGAPLRMALAGALLGIPAFMSVILAASLQSPTLFLFGNLCLGFSGALFGHGTLTATMQSARENQAGLALGAWGAVQATAAGAGVACSGILRDLIDTLAPRLDVLPAAHANGYVVVYLVEASLLVLTAVTLLPLVLQRKHLPETHAGRLQASS